MKKLKLISAFSMVTIAILSSCTLLVSSPLPPDRPSYNPMAYQSSDQEDLPPKYDMFFPADLVSDIKYAAWETLPTDSIDGKEVYSLIFQIPLEGGSYEFECESGQFYISKVYDSSMGASPSPKIGRCIHQQRNCYQRGPHSVQWDMEPITTSRFKYVHASVYNGSFYKITCNQKHLKRTWKIDFEPVPPPKHHHRSKALYNDENAGSDAFVARSVYVIMWDKTDECDFVFQFEQGDFELFTDIE